MSQNNYPYSTFPSSRNDNLTQVRNKFNTTLSNFEQTISNIKNKVTNTKREANSNKYSDFTIWLNSFENFLLELGEQIDKLTNKEMDDLKKTVENNNFESHQNTNSENQQENIEPYQSIETIRQPDNVKINYLSETHQNQPTITKLNQLLAEA
ncbi:hypothetical protein F8M41_023755 [Gigaspora margarita]|uniref:Uncharacterized protein n=1 Tax=Gigaspora margarita TaxID=4874 RepID=A0A8H4ACS2_GIGMA|nr:hypothetical protein F8M41_023755 [Gigaspora margarita]